MSSKFNDHSPRLRFRLQIGHTQGSGEVLGQRRRYDGHGRHRRDLELDRGSDHVEVDVEEQVVLVAVVGAVGLQDDQVTRVHLPLPCAVTVQGLAGRGLM